MIRARHHAKRAALGVEIVEVEGEVHVHLGRNRPVEVVGMPPDVRIEEVSGAAVVDVLAEERPRGR